MSKSRLITMIVTVFVLLVPVFAWADLTNGLVGYWQFDDPGDLGIDSSIYGNNGTISNSFVSYIAEGKLNGAVKFIEGSNAGIVVPNSASLNIQNSITITAWVKLDGQNTDNGNTIISRTGTYEPYSFFASLGGIGGEPQDNGAMGAYFWNSGVTSNYYVQTGTWTHLGMTYNGSTVNFYVNGLLVSSTPLLAPLEKSHRRRANNGGSGFHRYQCMSI